MRKFIYSAYTSKGKKGIYFSGGEVWAYDIKGAKKKVKKSISRVLPTDPKNPHIKIKPWND